MQKLTAELSFQLPQLNHLIECISFYSNRNPKDNENYLFEGYPEGVFELIFQSNNSVWQKACNEKIWCQRENAFLGGLHQQSFQLKLPPETEIMSIRFKHGAFKHFFSGRLNDFINQRVPITDLWSTKGKLLQAKLNNQPSRRQKINVIAAFIDSQIDSRKYSVIDQSVQSILDCKGMIDMSQLEQSSQLSSAQFRKRFREEVGLPPKKFAKVIKINAILAQFEGNHGKQSLIDLVYDFGYFDQSHFNKDFKAVVGKTPTQFSTTPI